MIRNAIDEGLTVLAPDAKITYLNYTEKENTFE